MARKRAGARSSFAEYFVPTGEKFAYFLVLLLAAVAPLVIFSILVRIRPEYLLNAVADIKSVVAVSATYIFACFSVKRSIPLWQSFLVIFVPELFIVLLLASRYGPIG